MIAGLPGGTWVLMAFAVVPGIVLVTAAYRVHRRGDARDARQRPDGGHPQAPAPQRDAGHARASAPQPEGGAPRQAKQRGEAGRG